jgi:hypothetical protein
LGSSKVIATLLDQEMLELRGVALFSRLTPDAGMPARSGHAVFEELGGRYLLKYLIDGSARRYSRGTSAPMFTTPTPVPVHDLSELLALPGTRSRRYVLVIDPRPIADIRGPRWTRLGMGIEYLLPGGFPATALVPPRWPISVG